MLSQSSIKKTVAFEGVDWSEEEKKSQEGVERRRREKQKLEAKRRTRKMSSLDEEQLKSFLEYVASNDIQETMAPYCDCFLGLVEMSELVAFPDEQSSRLKLRLSLEHFDAIKTDRSLLRLLQTWMYYAVENDKSYSLTPPHRSPSSPSKLSDLTTTSDGSLQTVSSLSSHSSTNNRISKDEAVAYMRTAVSAAYQGGVLRNMSHEEIAKVFDKIFHTQRLEFTHALLAEATEARYNNNNKEEEEEEDWLQQQATTTAGNCNQDSSSVTSKSTAQDDLAARASTAFATKAQQDGLGQTKIEAFFRYCFKPFGNNKNTIIHSSSVKSV